MTSINMNIALGLMAVITLGILYLLGRWLKKETLFDFCIKKQDLKLKLVSNSKSHKTEKLIDYGSTLLMVIIIGISVAFKQYGMIVGLIPFMLISLISSFSKNKDIQLYHLTVDIEGKESVVEIYDSWFKTIPDNQEIKIQVGKSAIDGALNIRKFEAQST